MLRRLGLFRLARLLFRRNLVILCYHGLSLRDEHLFRPGLFMAPGTFRHRIARLEAMGVPVLGLADAIKALEDGTLPRGAVVITIDDGWYGVHRYAAPVLEEAGFPATLYVTTYYVEKEQPVFNLLVDYLFWKTEATRVDLSEICPDLPEPIDLGSDARREGAAETFRLWGGTLDAAGRYEASQRLAERLGIDFAGIERERLFHLLTLDEIHDLSRRGLDIQLHTHRHFGEKTLDSRPLLEEEISRNREVLSRAVSGPFVHYCFPSGLHRKEQRPWLQGLGIETATTTEPGVNRADTDPLFLKRFLDGENVSEIRFEAEVSGIGEVMRRVKRWVRGRSA